MARFIPTGPAIRAGGELRQRGWLVRPIPAAPSAAERALAAKLDALTAAWAARSGDRADADAGRRRRRRAGHA